MDEIKIHAKQSMLKVIVLLSITLIFGGCFSETQTADPIVVDFPVAYIKRPIPVDSRNQSLNIDVRQLDGFHAGADLYLKDRSTAGAQERNITNGFTHGMGDVKDLNVSYDGNKFIFSMRAAAIEDAAPEQQPTWNIWEYNLSKKSLRRIITSDITAETGQDITPHYLPDGRIIFSSTRQRQSGAILLDEGKPKFTAENEDRNGPAFSLHVMNSDGSDIHQISFNQSHDFSPTVISSGEVVFSRWDNMGDSNSINLYKMRPDGTNLQLLYGAHSHNTGTNNAIIQFLAPREMPDGRIVTTILPFRGSNGGSDLVAIDVNNYGDNHRAINAIKTVTESAAQRSLVNAEIHTDSTISPNGLYRSAAPLWDGTGRLLVSWSPCRLMQGAAIVTCNAARLAQIDAVAAPALYSIYIFDPKKGTHAPLAIPTEGIIIEAPVIAQARPLPAILIDNQLGTNFKQSLVSENSGILHIRSVYDIDGSDSAIPNLATLANPTTTTADNRPARFLRIIKGVSLPNRNVLAIPNSAFGPSNQLMREIIGYAAIEPDGSVMVKVPANVPLTISVLDKNGRSISQRHQSWLQVRPGEIKQCNGCHNHSSGIPHGRNDAAATVNNGAMTSSLPFPGSEPTLIAEMAETMAQTRVRISCETNCAALTPSVDVVFDDHWTDANQRAKAASFSYRYADLTTPTPISSGCITQWNTLCRTIINYETHIHPLWNVDRRQFDSNTILIADHTCNSCHTSANSNAMPQVPPAQLDLSNGPSNDVATQFNAYRELLFADNEVELDVVNNILQDRLIQASDNNGNLRFETDVDGNLILDINNQPIPVMIAVRASGPSMSGNGANRSSFFAKVDAGGSHAGWLTPAELRLIAEWLDIGAQYFNNPFDVPQ